MEMFCNQCEQAAKGTGCEIAGVCGKQPTTSVLLDLLTLQLKGIAHCGVRLRKQGWSDAAVDRFVMEGLFTTVTNVNFDDERLLEWVMKGQSIKTGLMDKLGIQKGSDLPRSVTFIPENQVEELRRQALVENLLMPRPDSDLESLRQLILYGLRGMAAYADHALILGESDPEVNAFFYRALDALNDGTLSAEALTALALEVGKVNIRTMELLDKGHTGHFGNPEPTEVSTGTKAGPAIVVSGHDLVDLEALLKQTEGTGVQIYTHGEMLPAHRD